MTAERSAEEEASESPRSFGARLRGRSQPVTVTVVVAVVSGFLLTSAMATGREVAEARQSRHGELVALIEARRDHVDGLQARLEELRTQLARAESAADPAGGLRGDVATAERAAGLTALAGPGLRLRLDDADGPCPTGETADCRIRDRDLQSAVNTLFSGGAEAVSVNDERVVATTAIRNAGSSVLVNYRVLGPPYDVEAIGDPETLRAHLERSELARDFEVWTDHYGLGFDVATADELRVPAYSGPVRTRAAAVRPDGATGPGDGEDPFEPEDPFDPDHVRRIEQGLVPDEREWQP